MAQSDIGGDEAGGLIGAGAHSRHLTSRRASIIIARARLVAALFAVLTPLWIVVDIMALAPGVWRALVPLRLLTAAAFAAACFLIRGKYTPRGAYYSLALLYVIPAVFFVSCFVWMLELGSSGLRDGFLAGYAYIPFVMLGTIAMFPLTVVEVSVFSVLMLLVHSATLATNWPNVDWPAYLSSFWVLALIAALAGVAALSQLAFLTRIVRDGIHDSLLGCYSRRCGEELIDLQFVIATRYNARIAMALVAVDQFQGVNDRFGYAAGDKVLLSVAEILHDSMRSGDLMVRWLGDQFLLVYPNATAEHAYRAVRRFLAGELGTLPNRDPVTASVGIAERVKDGAEDWWRLVDSAADRLRKAQAEGGNRTFA